MAKHKITTFALFEDFKTYVEALDNTVEIDWTYVAEKGWIVVE